MKAALQHELTWAFVGELAVITALGFGMRQSMRAPLNATQQLQQGGQAGLSDVLRLSRRAECDRKHLVGNRTKIDTLRMNVQCCLHHAT